MNELQQVEFDMLKEVVKICNELHLKYYLICGSALGAIKYNGFIPWDDDVDIGLPRHDYDIFIDNAARFLPEHIFLQNYVSDGNYVSFSSKLRDSRTTYIEIDQKDRNINHGVFIDIVPLDEYIENNRNYKKKYKKFRYCKLAFLQSKAKYKNVIKCVLRPIINRHKIYQDFEHYLRTLNTLNYCNLHNSKGGKEYLPKTVYGDGFVTKFEGMDVRVPEQYDYYLTCYYGNWRADLPSEEQVGHHYCEILDINRPYTDYIERSSRNGRKIKLKKISS